MTDQVTYSCRGLATGQALSIHVKGGVIAGIDHGDAAPRGAPLIIPALVDLQVNGFMGHDLNEGHLAVETVIALSRALSRVGVCAYLPTLITAGEDEICQRLTVIRQAVEECPTSGKMIAGIHIEGPAISHLDGPRGAHPAEHVRPASVAEFVRWQEACGGLVKIVTLAPETGGACKFIKHVTSTGVVVSLGHSNADEEDVARAVDAGATMSTHLGNGISNLLLRHPNAIWAQLADDRLTASFIADRHHLPKSTLTAMIRAKGVERSLLISDSVRFAGQPAGRYHSAIGGDVEVSQDGRVSIAGTPFLAGSGSCLLDILLGFPEFTGMPLEDAVTMACSAPARHIGLKNELAEGQPANFILLEQDGKASKPTVSDIIFDGESVM